MPHVSRPSHNVTLSINLRPFVTLLNRELARLQTEPVGQDELGEVDRMLHQRSPSGVSDISRCSHCRGYMTGGAADERSCLICGRPAAPAMQVQDVVRTMVTDLIAYREGSSAGQDGRRSTAAKS